MASCAEMAFAKMDKFFLVFTCFLFFATSVCAEDSERSKVLLVIVDGFGSDYLLQANLSGFDSFLVNGSKAQYLTPVFPSTTFPNVFSILTGVYPENHGFVADVVYDPTHAGTDPAHNNTSGFFTGDESNFEEQPYWWNTSDPVWVTAKEQGVMTGVYSLFGCEVPVRGVVPFVCQRYAKMFHQDTLAFEASLEQAIKALESGNINLAIVYSEYLDIHGHNYGPIDRQMIKAVQLIDHAVGQLLNYTATHAKLADKLNIIIASDHGMANTVDPKRRISLDTIIKEDDIEFVTGSGAFAGIYPKADKLMKVYDDLKKAEWLTTWKRNDIPEKYHIKMSNRTAPIVVAAKKGYQIVPMFSDMQIPKPQFAEPITQLGTHGYDPSDVKEMNGIFLARGPGIKKNITSGPLEVVDVYNMMNCLLNTSGHPNNGSWSRVCGLLESNCSHRCHGVYDSSAFTIRPIGYWLLSLAFIVFAVNR